MVNPADKDRRGAAAETCWEKNVGFRDSIERIKDRPGEKLDVIIIALIIYSAVTIALETTAGLSPGVRSFLDLSRLAVREIFTAE